MAQSDLALVIMAGGAGTRFWPASTERRPKQFLTLFGERSLLQTSYDRVATLAPPERILVLTNAAFVPLVREQLPQLPEQNVIGEPLRRDTAAAVALAALICERRFGAATTMAILTADHLIKPTELFQRTLLSAARGARTGDALYTFGIRPTFPATGYGYLQRGAQVSEEDGIAHYQLQRFREKPDAATAQQYIDSGAFYWNSGMFVWTTTAILGELRQHLPDHLTHLRPAVAVEGTPAFAAALQSAFAALRPISIDFGVMERAASVRCVASTFEWSDVGGWLALEDHLPKDAAGNAHRGALYMQSASDNLVFCEEQDETVALVGVSNLVVVRCGKRTLVVDRGRTEEIKKLVQGLDPELR